MPYYAVILSGDIMGGHTFASTHLCMRIYSNREVCKVIRVLHPTETPLISPTWHLYNNINTEYSLWLLGLRRNSLYISRCLTRSITDSFVWWFTISLRNQYPHINNTMQKSHFKFTPLPARSIPPPVFIFLLNIYHCLNIIYLLTVHLLSLD